MTASSLRLRANDALVMAVAHRLNRTAIGFFTTDQLAEMYFARPPLRQPPVPLRARPARRHGGRRRAGRGPRHVALAGRQGLSSGKSQFDRIAQPDGLGRWEEGGQEVIFCLEYDRSTETLEHLGKKLKGYCDVRAASGLAYWIVFCFGHSRREAGAWRVLAQATVPVATAALGPTQRPQEAIRAPVGKESIRLRLGELAGVPIPPQSEERIAETQASRRRAVEQSSSGSTCSERHAVAHRSWQSALGRPGDEGATRGPEWLDEAWSRPSDHPCNGTSGIRVPSASNVLLGRCQQCSSLGVDNGIVIVCRDDHGRFSSIRHSRRGPTTSIRPTPRRSWLPFASCETTVRRSVARLSTR